MGMRTGNAYTMPTPTGANSSNRNNDPQALVAPVVEFLRRHAPFDQMSTAHVEYLAKRLRSGFYAKGSAIADPDEGPAQRFYVIKQGRVRGESRREGETDAWELSAGECFPIGALLARRPVHTVHRAAEDTVCLEIDRTDFETLLAQSGVFHDFCTRRLANLLDQALRSAQAESAAEVSGDRTLNTPLASLIHRDPVTCAPTCTIQQAIEKLHAKRVGSVVIVDKERRPLGIFTLHDLLSRVALVGEDMSKPITDVMTPDPISLHPPAFAYEAALLMARKGFGHLCVVEDGRLVGVLSERDLFALQRVGLVHLSRAIHGAPDVDSLARLGKDVHTLVDQMLAQGASVEQLAQIITLLNDAITRRVIELALADEEAPVPEFTWVAFGSEGRLEQTLKTDQDNGIIFEIPEGSTAEETRERLLPLARRINKDLDRCGFPLCTGNIMAGNPECCMSTEEWKRRFADWIEQGTPEHLLKANIFFDFRTLLGDDAPAQELREFVLSKTAAAPRFLRLMAENSLRNRPPLGLVRDFVVSGKGDKPHTLDLKLNGATPFVDGARILALAHGVGATNTLARLRETAERGALRKGEAEAWCDSLSFIQLLRMRAHQRHERAGEAPDNRIDPDSLNELDRRILKEAFRQARKLQSKVGLDYQL